MRGWRSGWHNSYNLSSLYIRNGKLHIIVAPYIYDARYIGTTVLRYSELCGWWEGQGVWLTARKARRGVERERWGEDVANCRRVSADCLLSSTTASLNLSGGGEGEREGVSLVHKY